jgi:MFS family permease
MRAESSPAARTGAFIAVALALFCIQPDFFALNLAVPGIAGEFGVTASAAQWTLSACMLAIGCCFVVGGRVGDVFGRRGSLLAGTALFAAGSRLFRNIPYVLVTGAGSVTNMGYAVTVFVSLVPPLGSRALHGGGPP